VVAIADRVNGDVTSEPLAGLLTVTLAIAGSARAMRREDAADNLLTIFMKFLFECLHSVKQDSLAARSLNEPNEVSDFSGLL
jgi:Sec7-like guanine-nucleotide exchange factor